MKLFKLAILVLVVTATMSATAHKFYVSTTNVEYVKEKQAIQVISKIFIDDIEDVLQERYSDDVSLATTKETKKHELLLKQYLIDKLKFKVNGNWVTPKYVGREYETDVVKVYFEIDGITNLQSLEVENKALMELFSEQQNIIHIKTPTKRRSMLLDADNPKGLLKFN